MAGRGGGTPSEEPGKNVNAAEPKPWEAKLGDDRSFQNLDNFILFTSNMQVTLDFYICIISGEV